MISCEKISFGFNKARILLENEEKIIVTMDKLESYCSNGLVFNKKMLYKNGKSTGKMVFMQLLEKRGNFSLYRNVEFDRDSNDPLTKFDSFYVYSGDELYLALSKKTLPSVYQFFELKWSYK